MNLTLQGAGQEHKNQTNIAIVAFERHYGVRRYVRVLGDPITNDTFVGFQEYESNLYILGKREEVPDNIWLRTFNVYLAIIRVDSGYITQELRMGSRALQDVPHDLQVNHQGVWLLASIGTSFCQSTLCTTSTSDIWDNGFVTQPSLAILLLKHTGPDSVALLDLDMRPINSILATRLTQLPTRLFLHSDNTLFLMGQRQYLGSGLYYTRVEVPLFESAICVDAWCEACQERDRGRCMRCKANYANKEGVCVPDGGPVEVGYYQTIDKVSARKVRNRCHYLCQECDPIQPDICTVCNPGTHDLYVAPGISTCRCKPGTYAFNDQCATLCPPGYYGISTSNTCVTKCPSNSYESVDFLTQTQRSQTWQSVTYQDGLVLTTTSRPLVLNITGGGMSRMPQDFTMSMWVMYVDPTQVVDRYSSYNYQVMNAFGRIKVELNRPGAGQTHQAKVEVIDNEVNKQVFVNGVETMQSGRWRKVVVSLKSTLVDGLHDMLVFISGTTLALDYSNQQLNLGGYSQYPFDPIIYVGAYSLSSERTFSGTVREIILIGEAYSLLQIKQDQYRMYRPGGRFFDRYHEIYLYFKLDKQGVYRDGQQNTDPALLSLQFTDASLQGSTAEPITAEQLLRLSTPRYKKVPESLTLHLWNDVALCTSILADTQTLWPVVMRGDQLGKGLSGLTSIQGDPSISFNPTDMFDLCQVNCSCASGVQGRFQISGLKGTSSTTLTGLYLNAFTAHPPSQATQGFHYEICYKKHSIGQRLAISMGTIYVLEPVRYVYPFNTGVIINKLMEFKTDGGDLAFGDRLLYSIGGNCSSIDFGTSGEVVTFTRTFEMKHKQNKFANKGRYVMCWQAAALSEYDTQSHLPTTIYNSFIHVNDFNFFFGIHLLELKSSDAPNSLGLNERYVQYDLEGEAFLAGDLFRFFSSRPQDTPCFVANRKGMRDLRFYNLRADGTPYFAPIWFGSNVGVNGVTTTINYDNYLHLCHTSIMSEINDGYNAMRVENYITNMASYTIKLEKVTIDPSNQNRKYPEIQDFSVEYGGTISPADDISFRFYPGWGVQVYPCGHPRIASQRGKIEIQRMGIDQTGGITETSEYLYRNHNLSDLAGLEPRQGEVSCDGEARCAIVLDKKKTFMPGEVYQIVFYTYSFMIRGYSGRAIGEPDRKYYLFGESSPNVETVYKHLFFARGWELQPPQSGFVSPDSKLLMLQGKSLLYQSGVRVKYQPETGVIENSDFETQAINITFWVTGNPYCSVLKVPHGTVLKRDIKDNSITIRDMQFFGCQWGKLYANIYLWRGIKNSQTGHFTHLYVTNMRDVNLGTLGCPEGCLRCNGTGCLLCSDSQNKFLSNGTCLNQCPQSSPYYLTYIQYFNNSEYQGNQCYETCPPGFYNPERGDQGDPIKSILCLNCFNGCQMCTRNQARHCDQCSPVRYLFRGTCLPHCPDSDLSAESTMLDSYRFFKENYTDYTCSATSLVTQENRLGNIEVKAVPIGYKRAVPIEQLTVLKATIKLRRGTLKGLYFKQLDPQLHITPKTNLSDPLVKRALVFDQMSQKMDLRTGQMKETIAFAEMKSSTFKYQSEKLVYHIMVKVENDRDDYGYDIFEFYANRNPVARELYVTSKEKYHNYTYTTIMNITTVNMARETAQKGWFDNEDDKYSKLSYQLHVVSRTQKFLIYPSIPRLETFVFKIPHVADMQIFMEVDIYVTATDKDGASTSKYVTMNISNTYKEDHKQKYMQELYGNLTQQMMKNDPTNLHEVYRVQSMLANLFEIMYRPPIVPVYTGVVCQFDEDCYNGRCEGGGFRVCKCSPGYVGTYCQMKVDEYPLTINASRAVIEVIDKYFENKTYPDAYTSQDLLYAIMTLKGLLQNFETIKMSEIHKVLGYMHKAIHSHTQVVYSLERDFYDDFFDLIGRILGKAHYDETLYRLNLVDIDSDLMQRTLEKVRECLDEFCRVILLKMDPITFSSYSYPFDKASYTAENVQDLYLEVKLKQVFGSDIIKSYSKGQAFKVSVDDMSFQSFTVNLPSELMLRTPGVLNETELRIKFVAYRANPFLGRDQATLLDSPYLNLTLYDAACEPLDLPSLAVHENLIAYQLPYSPVKSLDLSSLKCKTYINGTFEQVCGLRVYNPQQCYNCTGDLNLTIIATCFCNQSIPNGLALVYDEPQIVEPLMTVQLAFYADRFFLSDWRQSLGFRISIAGGIMYILGLCLSIAVDIKPRQRILVRLMQDLRDIDRYTDNNTQKTLLEEEVKEIGVAQVDKEGYEGGESEEGEDGRLEEEIPPQEETSPQQPYLDLMDLRQHRPPAKHKKKSVKKPKKKQNDIQHPIMVQSDQISPQEFPDSLQPEPVKQKVLKVKAATQSAFMPEEQRLKVDKEEEIKSEGVIEGDKILHLEEFPQTEGGDGILNSLQDEINPRISVENQEYEKPPHDTENNYHPKEFGKLDLEDLQGKISKKAKKKKGVTTKKQLLKDDPELIVEAHRDNEDQQESGKVTANEVEDKIDEEIKESNEQESLKIQKARRLERLTSTFARAFQEPELDLLYDLGEDLSVDFREHLQDPNILVVPSLGPPNPTDPSIKPDKEDLGMSYNEKIKKKKLEEKLKREKRAVIAERKKARFSELITTTLTSEHLRPSRFTALTHELNILLDIEEDTSLTFGNLVKYGNPIANFVLVDSYLQPRHVRWTILFLDILLIWFLTGMYFKNTRSIQSVLTNKINQDSSVKLQEIMVAMIIPFGNAVAINVLRSLFRVTDARLRSVLSVDIHSQHEMLRELKKEISLRFLFAYSLSTSVLAAFLWYFVSFTQLYGWQLSWFWLSTGFLGAFIRFIGYEIVICILYSWMTTCKWERIRRFGRWLSLRRVQGIARQEA